MPFLDPPDGRPWALLALCGGSLFLNAVLAVALASRPSEREVVVPAPEPAQAAVAVVAEPAPNPVSAEGGAAIPGDVHVIRAPVEQSLARTFQLADPEHGDVLSAVYARLFVWDLDLRRDLQRGDDLAIAYEWDGEFPAIPAASYHSGKLGKLVAYRFQATGDAFPSWWDADGQEVPRRLIDGPLAEYEQVTSLLRDRPKHKGMDFKVPVGTDVRSPRSGTVVRADWNWQFNGNCVEVRYEDGTLARFLHLSRTDVRAGQRVAAGDTVGLSGNTGRSTAPHLHYELERNGAVVDPVDYHGVTRRRLAEEDRAAFASERARLDALLDAAT